MQVNQVSNVNNYLVASTQVQPTSQIESESTEIETNDNSIEVTTINTESTENNTDKDDYSNENSNQAAVYVPTYNSSEQDNNITSNYDELEDITSIVPEEMPTVKPKEPEEPAYSKNPNLTPAEVEIIMKKQEKEMEEFQKALMKEIVEQSELAEYSYIMDTSSEDLTVEVLGNSFTGVAQKAVSDGGYYGVQNTAERILDSAQAISSNDPDKMKLLKEETEKGFQDFSESYGGINNMPDITKKSYNLVMEGFDEIFSII